MISKILELVSKNGMKEKMIKTKTMDNLMSNDMVVKAAKMMCDTMDKKEKMAADYAEIEMGMQNNQYENMYDFEDGEYMDDDDDSKDDYELLYYGGYRPYRRYGYGYGYPYRRYGYGYGYPYSGYGRGYGYGYPYSRYGYGYGYPYSGYGYGYRRGYW